MLKICPQCSAEILEQAEECFGCGAIFSLQEHAQTFEHRVSPSRIAKTKDNALPRTLLLGQTIENRFTVQEQKQNQGLWVLYRVVDQRDGCERWLQMGVQAHKKVRDVVDVIHSLGTQYYLPDIVDVGANPAPFLVFDNMEGSTLFEWKKEAPSMRQRLDFCGQVLHLLTELNRQGLDVGAWDIHKIFVHDHGFLSIHPTILSVRSGYSVRVLEWIYWMLCDRVQNLQEQSFVLSGLSMRYAQWLRMMVRRKASSHQLKASWSKEQENDYGMDSARARTLYEQLSQEFVFCDHGKTISFDLTYACAQNLIFGTIDCHEGGIIGYVDRVLLAWEGLYFDPDIGILDSLYRRLVLDDDVPLSSEEPVGFEERLIRVKILFLLRLDWEEALERVITKAQTFDEWMEINRFRVLYDVQKDKIVVPKPKYVREYLQLASFFYWFAVDEEEAQLWFDEAVQKSEGSVFDLFVVLEAHCSMFGIPSSETFSELRRQGLEYGLDDQILLLERMEDRLGIVDEEWISLCTYENTHERILWCTSRFSNEEERKALDEYGVKIQEQLQTFSIVVEHVSWENIEEYERQLSRQIQWLAQVHRIGKIFVDEGFTPPALNPPFVQGDIVEHIEQLERLRQKRQEEIERKRAEEARKDGYVIFLLMLVGLVLLGVAWLQF